MSTAETPVVTLRRDGPVAVARFERPRGLNAFDQDLILELTRVARAFHDDLCLDAAEAVEARLAVTTPIDPRG